MVRKINAAFMGGLLGALVDSFNIWILGRAGVTASLGIGLRPDFTPDWLYPRLVWGGLWGLLFLLPVWKGRPIRRGLLFSLAPTLMVLLFVFPSMGRGLFGLGYGVLTPPLVLVLNFLWGIIGAAWFRMSFR